MGSRALAVLMWKHTVVRIRRFIQTTVEFVSPLLFFILLFAFKNNIRPQYKSAEIESPVAYTDVIPLSEMPAPTWVLYYPDTPLTKSLMDEVGSKLNLQRLNQLPDASSTGYYPIANESQILEFIPKMHALEAVVIFQEMNGESWPNRLNFTIRMKDVFHIESYESEDETPGPHRMFGLNYGTFMRLQWAIDTSYIKLLTGNEITQTVHLQEFPYYHTRKSMETVMLCKILSMLCWLSLMLPFVFLTCRLLNERTSGILELMKMVGVSNNIIGVSHFLNVLPGGLVFAIGGTILLKSTSNPLLTHTNGFLLFLMLLLYFVSVISMAFACSFISKSSRYAATLAVMAYIMLWLPRRLSGEYKLPYLANLASGLFPHSPMYWFWEEISALEVYGSGLTFSNMMKTHAWNNFPAFACYLVMLLQSAIFFGLSWYLSLVMPGKYGQAQPWNFLWQAQYWNKNHVRPDTDSEEEEMISQDVKFFEPPPANAEVGIRIVNVSKNFPKHKALKHVTMDVYKGEITVLLGHNGAGKTTLMSIITGMTSPTEGKVYVNGKDTVTESDEVRKSLGLCPQHNMFFPDLTVQEHIMFFTMLKEGSYGDARKSSVALAEQLALSERRGALVGELSGGMQRRAQLACALAGGARVLVLDEPTSGLDVQTRRDLWDLLLSLRGSRTVLLTTHFMEEADALGDRVAALHAGELRCLATTMYLKKAVGTGYRLSFTTIGLPREEAIAAVVTSYVPDATLKERTMNSISFSLPATASAKFPKLFSQLESRRSELALDSIGVGVSTLEEVFLKLCSDVDPKVSYDVMGGVRALQETAERVTGLALYYQQLKVLLKRQVIYAIHKKWTFLIMQVILPVLVIVLMTAVMNNPPTPSLRARALDLDVFAGRERRVLLQHGLQPHLLRTAYPDVTFSYVDDVADAVLSYAKKDILEYNKYLIGLEVNETDAKILYTTTVRHAAPVALSALGGVLAARLAPWADAHTLTTLNEPLQSDRPAFFGAIKGIPKDIILCITWGLSITFVFLATNINCVSLACAERASGARHIHVMSGCPAALHWAAALSAHLAAALLALVLPALLAAGLLDRDNTINDVEFLMAFAVILILGTMSFLSFAYILSFNFGEKTTSIILVASIIVFGMITPFMKTAQEMFSSSPTGVTWVALSAAELLAPPHTLVTAALQALMVARLNAWCRLMRPFCPNFFLNEIGMDIDQCCAGHNPRCYFCFDKYSPAKGMLILGLQFCIMMTLVVLTQRGVFNGLLDKMWNVGYRAPAQPELDDMVRAERTYVSKAISLPVKQITDTMLVNDIHKNYVRLVKKNVNAVKGVSFSVKKGECFGLLGVNGAGKSTTFKMLTAEECTTKGNIYVHGQHLRRGTSKYLQMLGYCPQFFGLDMFQTGEQNLRLMLTLRGYAPSRVKQEVEAWIKIVGLEKYSKRRVEAYSGGCVRRLGAAAALCGGARVTLLDEPSSGVDVAARRRLWAALRATLRHQRSVIISSHSMDEMEAMCARMAILSGGVVRALGTATALRAAHAQGHAVRFKISNTVSRDEVDGYSTQINRLKEKLNQKFNCTLKDEHSTMLHYHIDDTMRYSELFCELEALRQDFPTILEDYSVTETTLEEVFLSFAKEQEQTTQAV